MRSQISVGLCLIGVVLAALSVPWEALALPRETSAAGDDCTIDLPSGLKKPGKINKDGKCCSIWDSSECYDVPKTDKDASALKARGKAVATVGMAGGGAATGTTPVQHGPFPGKSGATAVSGASGSPSRFHSVAQEHRQHVEPMKSSGSPSPTPSASPKSKQ